jgi:predicted metal-dependent phosphoesterase TrpH
MRCDLHVHTLHSGMCEIPVLRRVCRESYNRPDAVYARLKSRGMDLVTVTDHDSIGASDALRSHPDFFLSEEVTCKMPDGSQVHLGVYDIHERDHIEIQQRADDFLSLVAYLRERRLFFSANHVFSSLTGVRHFSDFDWLAAFAPAFETRNGLMPATNNRYAARFARECGKRAIGGSDAHAMSSVGSAYTEVEGARNKEEFFAGLRAGRGRVRGEHGGYFKLTRDVLMLVAAMIEEQPWTAILAPLALAVPFVTLGNCAREAVFARYWMWRLQQGRRAFPMRPAKTVLQA